jgi:hypothetical protein
VGDVVADRRLMFGLEVAGVAGLAGFLLVVTWLGHGESAWGHGDHPTLTVSGLRPSNSAMVASGGLCTRCRYPLITRSAGSWHQVLSEAGLVIAKVPRDRRSGMVAAGTC